MDHAARLPEMGYLQLPRARHALLLFLASSLLLAWFPGIDLRLSSWFYDGDGFHLAHRWWTTLLHESVGYFIVSGLAAVLGIYAFNRIRKCNACGVDGRVVRYVLLVLVLGAGLIVNGFLKNGFGRARPRNVVEFGGTQSFTPSFVVSNACRTNCSFASGDAAGAFFALALALALGRRRALVIAAAAFGGLVSFARIAAGAHFLSDIVVSFFVMWILADALHHYLFSARGEVARDEAPATIGAGSFPLGEAAELAVAPQTAAGSDAAS